MFEDTRMTPIGYIHVACSEGYFGYRDVVPRIAKLSPKLTDADLAEIQGIIDATPAVDRLAKTRAEDESPEAIVGDVPDAKAR
jgi:hypothetical protein